MAPMMFDPSCTAAVWLARARGAHHTPSECSLTTVNGRYIYRAEAISQGDTAAVRSLYPYNSGQPSPGVFEGRGQMIRENDEHRNLHSFQRTSGGRHSYTP
jgi:hypothetical protein